MSKQIVTSTEATVAEVKTLPCPFCGETRPPAIESMADEFDSSIMWAECPYCGAEGPASSSSEMAVARWNGRGRAGRVAIRESEEP